MADRGSGPRSTDPDAAVPGRQRGVPHQRAAVEATRKARGRRASTPSCRRTPTCCARRPDSADAAYNYEFVVKMRDQLAKGPQKSARDAKDEAADAGGRQRRSADRADDPRPAGRTARGRVDERLQDGRRRCATTSARNRWIRAAARRSGARADTRARPDRLQRRSRSAQPELLWLLVGAGAAARPLELAAACGAGCSHASCSADARVPVRERFAPLGDLPFWLCLILSSIVPDPRARAAARAGNRGARRRRRPRDPSGRIGLDVRQGRAAATAGSGRCGSCACSATP